NTDESDRLRLETLRMNMLKDGRVLQNLTQNEKALLSEIDNRRGSVAPEARDMLQLTGGEHEFVFVKINLPEINVPDNLHIYHNSQEYIIVFPNPAHDRLTVHY